MVGSVDQIGERRWACACAGRTGAAGGEIAAPVAGEIPERAADIGHIGIDHQAGLFGIESAALARATVVDPDAPADAPHRQFLADFALLHFPSLFFQPPAIGEPGVYRSVA